MLLLHNVIRQTLVYHQCHLISIRLYTLSVFVKKIVSLPFKKTKTNKQTNKQPIFPLFYTTPYLLFL
eukprot:UN00808